MKWKDNLGKLVVNGLTSGDDGWIMGVVGMPRDTYGSVIFIVLNEYTIVTKNNGILIIHIIQFNKHTL